MVILHFHFQAQIFFVKFEFLKVCDAQKIFNTLGSYFLGRLIIRTNVFVAPSEAVSLNTLMANILLRILLLTRGVNGNVNGKVDM